MDHFKKFRIYSSTGVLTPYKDQSHGHFFLLQIILYMQSAALGSTSRRGGGGVGKAALP
jgi:hypothetical protein